MIDDAKLDAVVASVAERGAGDATVRELRAVWPGIHFTYCLDDDVSAAAKPVRESSGFNLYLVAGAGGCISFTRDRAGATGIVIAETIEDED